MASKGEKREEKEPAVADEISPGEEAVDDGDLLGNTPSLLDSVQNRLADLQQEMRWTRLLIVGRLVDNHGKEHVGPHHAEVLEAARIDRDGAVAPVNGLGLIQAQSFVAFVESTPEVVERYAREIQKEISAEVDEPWAVEDVRVVAMSDDCPYACFDKWAYRIISLNKEQDIDLESEGVTDACFGVYSKLISMGRQLTEKSLSENDMNSLLDHIKQYYQDSLPSNERVLALTEREELFTLENHIEFYFGPLKVDLASERAWPLPRNISY